MSDLREAILAAYNEADPSLGADAAGIEAVLAVVEAYLREHDAQSQATGVKIVNDVIAANVLAERERIRQRIEALPVEVSRRTVLEALGGSDG